MTAVVEKKSKKIEKTEDQTNPKVDKAKILADMLKELRKVTESTTVNFSPYANVTQWTTTGDYGLNRIISGSVFKGLPAGKVVVFSGEECSGKTYTAVKMVSEGLKDGIDHVYLFDSEGGSSLEMMKALGCDISKIEHILVDSVDEATVKIMSTMDQIKKAKAKCPELRFMCVLDSLGGLVSKKFLNDAVEKKKQVDDAGTRAKSLRPLIVGLTMPAMQTFTPFILINHQFDSMSMYPSKIKEQGGGKSVKYMSRLTIQCSKLLEKTDDKGGEGSEKGYAQATKLRFFTVKNSFVRPYVECELYLDFTKGAKNRPFYSIFEPAVIYGFVVPSKQSGYFTVPSSPNPEKRYTTNEIMMNKDDVWSTFLNEFDKRSQEDLRYSNPDSILEEITQEDIDNDDVSDVFNVPATSGQPPQTVESVSIPVG